MPGAADATDRARRGGSLEVMPSSQGSRVLPARMRFSIRRRYVADVAPSIACQQEDRCPERVYGDSFGHVLSVQGGQPPALLERRLDGEGFVRVADQECEPGSAGADQDVAAS